MNTYDTNTKNELSEFLSPRDNLADYLDPLDYVSMVGTNLAKGKLPGYTLSELRKIEEKVSAVIAENYPSSVEEQAVYTQEHFPLVDGLNGLIVEAEKAKALETRKRFNSTYQSTRTKGDIFADLPLFDDSNKKYTVEEKVQLSVDLLERAEYSPEVLKAAQKRLRLLRAIGLDRTQDEKLHNLYQKFENTLNGIKEELANFDTAMANLNDLLATSKSPQEAKLPVQYTNVEDITELSSEDIEIIDNAPEIQTTEIEVDLSELGLDEPVPAYVAPKVDELDVALSVLKPLKESSYFSIKRTSTSNPLRSFAKAALVVAGFGAAVAGIGYSYFNSSVPNVNALEERASLSMSVDAPQIKETKPYAKASSQEASSQRPAYKIPVTEPVEVIAHPVLKVKPIPNIDPSKTVYSIQKGDTFVKLFKERGGNQDFQDWLKDVRSANPQIPDLDWVAPGQPVQLPQ